MRGCSSHCVHVQQEKKAKRLRQAKEWMLKENDP